MERCNQWQRGLNFRLRLPPGLEMVENDCRKLVGNAFSAKSQASLQYDKRNSTALPVINEAALAAILMHVEQLRAELGSLPPAAGNRAVDEGCSGDRRNRRKREAIALRNQALLDGLADALNELIHARSRGRAVATVLLGHVGEIEKAGAGSGGGSIAPAGR
ncbi:MAG: YicC/YloC family endoribonuclease [Nitratireductor sp.]